MSSEAPGLSKIFENLLIDNVPTDDPLNPNSLEAFFQQTRSKAEDLKIGSNYEECISNLNSFFMGLSSSKEHNVLLSGVASLRLFVACNWAGYKLQNESYGEIGYADYLNQILDPEGEGLYPVITNPELLAYAHLILIEGTKFMNQSYWFIDFWKLRVTSIHQECLLETSERLHSMGEKIISTLETTLPESTPSVSKALFYLEATCFFAKYRELNKMQIYLKHATELIGIEIEAYGALGKRTKFQQKDLAQYTLNIKSNGSSLTDMPNSTSNISLPVDMKLDDEVRLDKIAFKEERSEEPLNQIERATITAAFEVIRMSQPKDALTLEEVTPYLNSILAHNDTWSFQMSALYHRSMLESNESRTVERSMTQLSTLSEGLPTADENVARSRLKMIFVSQCLPFWKLEASLVKLFLALGFTSSALDLATRLELWEDVINCYHLLQLRHKAAEVIREQLSVKETPLLWCMLGDATDDISFYEKALDMSNGKFSRAHRSIGYHHYFKKDYKRSIESLKKSLELNGYQQHLRLRLGFAATECEEWELAASVYRSYCTFETDNFEAWNNLANAYIKLGQKSRAWKVLQEAAKCDYENWKIWENILTVSTDCAHFEEVIKAYNRVLDTKGGKFVDIEVLKILVRSIVEDIPDSYGRPTGKYFRKPTLKLFGRITCTTLDSSEVWELYSDLSASDLETPEEDRDYKSATILHKALPAAFKVSRWETDVQNVKNLLNIGHRLVEAAIKSSMSSSNKKLSIQLLSSVRMTLRSLLAKTETTHLDISTNEIIGELKDEVARIKEDINEHITNRINVLK